MSTQEKLAPGMVLGRNELLLPVAQGGMATVWAARQRGTRGFNKTVAIKTMLPALSDDAQFEQMFLDEAALAARIHHPNVAEILDLGEQDDILYIVMEWIEGEAVSVIHKAAKRNHATIPLRLALRVVRQAAAALHAAHELRDEGDQPLQLVHRDVSPQNILCTYDGIVKLVDFGVAKAVGRAGGETTAGQLKGKVPYMSPEQARGGVVDRRTDIFALGIVMYKLTTGLHPFLGDSDIVTMRNIISRPLIPPRLKNPAFPAEVEQILLRSLQKDPEKRYQTMAEVGTAIDRVLVGMGHGDDDLGAFVRSTMADRGTKRRAAVRDAVRVADERYATGTHAIVQLPPPPTVHEGASDAALTRMTTEVGEQILSDGAIGSGPSSGFPSSASFGLRQSLKPRTPPLDRARRQQRPPRHRVRVADPHRPGRHRLRRRPSPPSLGRRGGLRARRGQRDPGRRRRPRLQQQARRPRRAQPRRRCCSAGDCRTGGPQASPGPSARHRDACPSAGHNHPNPSRDGRPGRAPRGRRRQAQALVEEVGGHREPGGPGEPGRCQPGRGEVRQDRDRGQDDVHHARVLREP